MRYDSAKLVAKLAHSTQQYGGHSYMYHLQMVVDILMHYNYDSKRIAAAWLHDVLEDTQITYNDLEYAFDTNIAYIVEACTGRGKNRKERQDDIRVKLADCPAAHSVKLADRMANIQVCLTENNQRLLQMYLEEDQEFSQSVEEMIKADMWIDYRNMVKLHQPLIWLDFNN
jgi:guanosine-3',5'-bis(diphosphate) 3'-pyrophosphohydrolase